MLFTLWPLILVVFGANLLEYAKATPILYDGRASLNLTESIFDDLSGAYV